MTKMITARSLRHSSSSLALLAAAIALPGAGYAGSAPLPVGGAVAAGSASIAAGATTTINQSSSRAVLNWQSFDVGAGNAVVFNQPNAQAATLNRVTGATSSTIAGSITSNGAVYLVNPNGIAITSTGSVNTAGGFVASTLDIADADFMSGNLKFVGSGASNAVSNAGHIAAGQGAYVALLGGAVSNAGTITVPLGKVGLGSGESVALDLNGNGFMQVAVPTSALTGSTALIDNAGSIAASGGYVQLQAATVKDAVRNVINMSGSINADSATGSAGHISLIAGSDTANLGGTTTVSGSLSAQATGGANGSGGGDGGFIETSGATLNIADTARITTASANGTTGTWLIDPTDFTVAASGGDITGATLSADLALTNITIQTAASPATLTGTGITTINGAAGSNGDININNAVTWTSGNTLTLSAYRNIIINSSIDASGGSGGKLALQYGQGAVNAGNSSTYYVNSPVNLQAGQNFSTKLGSDGATTNYQVITSLGVAGSSTGTDLQGIRSNLAGNYVLGANIDASATSGWNSGAGFQSLGFYVTGSFTGIFDGLGHSISNLTIKLPTTTPGTGNVNDYAGLFGFSNGTIQNVGITSGSITGYAFVGGLIGAVGGGTVYNVYSNATVTGTTTVGGLIGVASTGQTGSNHTAISISNSYATGNVTANTTSGAAGGFIGQFSSYYAVSEAITNSYSTGNVSAAYAGEFSGSTIIYGTFGNNPVTFSNDYATGTLSGTYKGGFISYAVLSSGLGAQASYVNETNVYWNSASSGNFASSYKPNVWGSAGALNATQLKTASSFAGFTFSTSVNTPGWVILDTDGTFNNAGGAAGATTPMLTSQSAPNISTPQQFQLIGLNLNGSYTLTGNLNLSGTTVTPIGTLASPFTGSFNGGGFTISGLNINTPTTNRVGLFGVAQGSISNLSVSGSVTGGNSTGGVVGLLLGGGSLTNVTSAVNVTGNNLAGSLVGNQQDSTSITQSSASGTVSGVNDVGGLVGYSANASISRSSATGTVTGTTYAGGLVGYSYNSTISNTNAQSAVTNTAVAGGLVGKLNGGSVSNSFAAGTVSSTYFGGLIAQSVNGASVTSSYWNSTTGSLLSAGGVSYSTTALQSASGYATLFAGWDFTSIWTAPTGSAYPKLK